MFSSDQILRISGDLEHGDVKKALSFALDYFNESASDICYQVLENGAYCVGWLPHNEEPADGWCKYPFDYDIDIVARIIEKHLEKSPIKYGGGDGSYSKGFLMERAEGAYMDGYSVKNPFYEIVRFTPKTIFYHN